MGRNLRHSATHVTKKLRSKLKVGGEENIEVTLQNHMCVSGDHLVVKHCLNHRRVVSGEP